MKRKIILLQVLLTLILSILCGFALFGCKNKEPEAPEVKDVTITAVDSNSYGKAGVLHRVTYTATEGSEVSTSVQIGDKTATPADYFYLNDEYVFYTAGEYTVTVYAAKDGMLGQASAKITVHAAEASVSGVDISAAAGETLGKVGTLHILAYSADSDCKIQVDVKKDGEPATDVAFDSVYKTLVFRSAGNYTVTVTAILGLTTDSAQKEIEITGTLGEPTVSLSLDKNEAKESEEVMLNPTVTYASGDTCEKESVSVLYRAETTGEFLEAEEDAYTVISNKFTPGVAGEWKIVYKAQGKGGASGEAGATLTCKPAEISLSLKTQERQRIQTGKATDIQYLVTGEANRYDVSIDDHGNSDVEAELGEGYSVRVSTDKMDAFTVTVTYTHKLVPSVKTTLDIPVYSVENVTYAPVLGLEPFDGMPSDVLTSMGHLLYFNASSYVGDKRELTYRDVNFEIIERNVSAPSEGKGNNVELLNAAGDENYPYVIVSNFDDNVVTGDFTLKMTVTDPYTGYSAVAIKKFNVIATTNDNATAVNRIQSYVDEHSEFFQMANMKFDNAVSDCRQNMVLTKTGTIMQRSNPSWPLQNGAGNENADFAHMDFATAAQNCSLEFKFNLLGSNPTSGGVWLGIGMRTVDDKGWVGFFDLHLVGNKLDITNGLNNTINAEYTYDAERPLALSGTTMYVRIDRRVNGNLAEYTVYVKTEESAPYERYYRCTATNSADAGNVGAPVKQYQFTHRYAGGCYSVEDVIVTNYDS